MTRAVELISTGAELLSGRTVNRHAQTLAQALAPHGLQLLRDTTVPDDVEVIEEVLRGAVARADVVVLTGGLGPTADDVTRDAVARYLGRSIVMDSASLEEVRRKCREKGLAVNDARDRQALVVEGAEALPNSVGAAPGERLEVNGKVVFLLPGPPDEFSAVLNEHVLPWLAQYIGAGASMPERIFMTCGMAEADIVTRFDRESFPPENITAAYCAAPGRVEIRLTAATADADVEGACARVREYLGEHVFAEERMDMAEVVGGLLKQRGKTLATAESCTGGLLGHRLTFVSGSSDYYAGGVVAYSNQAKMDLLGVSATVLDQHGAVSEPVAGQMASVVRETLGADYGIGITGIAGPSGGTAEKPVGLVFIGVASAKDVVVRKFHFGGGRSRIKEWSAQMAMNMLRLRLLDASE